MAKTGSPRSGSLQFWPRKRASRQYARIRSWAGSKDAKPLGFAGYKVGMTHILVTDNRPNALTKGEEIRYPVTIIECPALKVAGIRFYKKTDGWLKAISTVLAPKLDKELSRKIKIPKQTKKPDEITDFDDLRIIVNTQPKLTGIGKKKPEIFEIALGGGKDDKLAYANEHLGKEIPVQDVFTEGQQVDIHAVTKGKGFQGSVKRFGIDLRSHKSEKTKRGPGSLGGWKAQAHVMWRIAYPGQHGYHLRTDYNKWILKISNNPKEINPKGGFVNYGLVKNNFVLVKGSIPGPRKRLIRFNLSIRPNSKVITQVPAIDYISTESKQG